jgi:phosphatidylinositol kinase/protein kinase (PI-3  family)
VCALVALMLDTGLPCFQKRGTKVLENLMLRFQVDKSEREAAQYMARTIDTQVLSFRSMLYDIVQNLQNGIPYG